MEKVVKAVEQKIAEHVSPPQIESVFRRFWREIAGGDSQAVLKFGTLNLVVFCTEAEAAQQIRSRLPEIIVHHPGRIIVVSVNDRSDDPAMSVNLYAYLQEFPEGQKQIVAEVVFLEMNQQGLERVSGAVLPLLLSDLPVFFWYADRFRRLDGPFLPLLRYVDRLVIRTEEEYQTVDEIAEMLEEILKLGQVCSVIDLNWLKQGPWREATARLFDQPENLKLLSILQQIEIFYSGEKPAMEALYAAAWLVSSLQKNPPKKQVLWEPIFQYRTNCFLPAVTLQRLKGGAGGLQKIKFIGKEGEKSVILTLAKEKYVFKASFQLGGELAGEYEFSPQQRCMADLLCNALDTVVLDAVFHRTCHHLLEFFHETSNYNLSRP